MLSSFLPRPTPDFSKVTPRIWFAGFFLQDSSEESLQANLRWIHSATPTNHRCSCNFHYFPRIPFQDAWSEGFSFQGILKEILTRKKGLNPSAGQISISTRVCVNVFFWIQRLSFMSLHCYRFISVLRFFSFHFNDAADAADAADAPEITAQRTTITIIEITPRPKLDSLLSFVCASAAAPSKTPPTPPTPLTSPSFSFSYFHCVNEEEERDAKSLSFQLLSHLWLDLENQDRLQGFLPVSKGLSKGSPRDNFTTFSTISRIFRLERIN